jgi:internalin A
MRCKSMVLSGVLFILMIFLTACSESNIKLEDTGPKQTIVKFENPGLEKALREALNKPSGDIYVNNLKKVKTLIAEFHKIQSLKGIEYCTSLEALSLSYNQINDLRPLAGLTSLVDLF